MRVASMGSNEGFVSGDGGFPVTRPKAFLRPPENLLARVRWIFLLFTLVNAVLVVVILNFLSPEETSPVIVGSVDLLVNKPYR